MKFIIDNDRATVDLDDGVTTVYLTANEILSAGPETYNEDVILAARIAAGVMS